MNAILKITEPGGKTWEMKLFPGSVYSVGRARENDIVLNDRRVSRKHAQIVGAGAVFKVLDGYLENGEIKRSINRVFVNGLPRFEKILEQNDVITIGETTLQVIKTTVEEAVREQLSAPEATAKVKTDAEPPLSPSSSPPPLENVNFDDKPLGQTQLLISADEIIGRQSHLSLESAFATPEEIKNLRRKAKVLELLYEMSKMLGTVFDLKEIFARATDLIFRGTPADRVVALLIDEGGDRDLSEGLTPIAVRARGENLKELTEKMTVSRTITQKVMREKVAVLSQDARTDEQFLGSDSIVSQGVRSTICAPLMTESNVHGVVYADRLDPFAAFSPDDLELISAVAAQAAVTVETVKAHRRLAREEVVRANYSRFLPEYVVRQLLEQPDSFALGGINQTITVLFSDIRGFTRLSENAAPELIVGLLNRYFSAMSEIIFAHGGTLDKYIGDGLMAIFGAPTATAEDAANAVRAAAAMQRRILTLNDELTAEGFAPLAVGIGLHTGAAIIGYVGSEKRSEYTAIGDTVNLAARLESQAAGGVILISETTARAGGNLFPLTAHEAITVKNRLQAVTPFEVKWN